MDAQIAAILEHLEALPARAANVEVDDKLIDHPLEERQVPTAAAHTLDLIFAQAAAPPVVASRRGERSVIRLRAFPIGLVDGAETPLDAICVIAVRVHPEHHARAGGYRSEE